jgi:hypothetical protein
VFVPHELTWALEHPDDEAAVRAQPGLVELASLVELVPWLRDGDK